MNDSDDGVKTDSDDEPKTDSDGEANTDSDDEVKTDSNDDEIDDSDNDLQVARRYSPSPPKLQRRVVSYERTTTEKWNYTEEYSD